jgi:hypothetical protein
MNKIRNIFISACKLVGKLVVGILTMDNKLYYMPGPPKKPNDAETTPKSKGTRGG